MKAVEARTATLRVEHEPRGTSYGSQFDIAGRGHATLDTPQDVRPGASARSVATLDATTYERVRADAMAVRLQVIHGPNGSQRLGRRLARLAGIPVMSIGTAREAATLFAHAVSVWQRTGKPQVDMRADNLPATAARLLESLETLGRTLAHRFTKRDYLEATDSEKSAFKTELARALVMLVEVDGLRLSAADSHRVSETIAGINEFIVDTGIGRPIGASNKAHLPEDQAFSHHFSELVTPHIPAASWSEIAR